MQLTMDILGIEYHLIANFWMDGWMIFTLTFLPENRLPSNTELEQLLHMVFT